MFLPTGHVEVTAGTVEYSGCRTDVASVTPHRSARVAGRTEADAAAGISPNKVAQQSETGRDTGRFTRAFPHESSCASDLGLVSHLARHDERHNVSCGSCTAVVGGPTPSKFRRSRRCRNTRSLGRSGAEMPHP